MIGIDISTYQSGIDFAAAKRGGIEFCILKAGGSNDGRYTDSKYRLHEPQARAAGMYIGHYWFNGTGDAVTDADYFVANLSNYQAGDLLVLDIENEGSMPAWGPDQAMQFCARVHSHLGVVPTLYMSSSVTRAMDWTSLVQLGSPLWVASYGANTGSPGPVPTNLGAWGNSFSLWQYTSNGTIAGYGGRVDMNQAVGNPFGEPSSDGFLSGDRALAVATNNGVVDSVKRLYSSEQKLDTLLNWAGLNKWALTGNEIPENGLRSITVNGFKDLAKRAAEVSGKLD